MAHDVFLSYSSKDKHVADATCALLESRGIRCWMAPRDIMPGSEWGASIIEAITGSRVMVLIYTSSSNASPQVRREVERAVARGLHVIPFRVEDVPMSPALEYFISAPHWLDALNPPLENHLNQLGNIISAVLSVQRGETPEYSGSGSSSSSTGAVGQRQTIAPAAPARRPFDKRLLVAAAAVLALIFVGVAILVTARSGGGHETLPPQQFSTVAPAHQQQPSPSPEQTQVVAPSNPKSVEKVADPVPSKVEPVSAPTPAPQVAVVSPPAPAVPPKRTEPNSEEVKSFFDLLASGNPSVSKLDEMLGQFPKLAAQKSSSGQTPLQVAAVSGSTDVMKSLIAAGADINPADKNGQTPLHLGIAAGKIDAIKFLLASHAKIDGVDAQGNTPLHLAAALPDTSIAEALLSAGAKVTTATRQKQTPLHVAAAAGNTAMVQLFINNGGSEVLAKGQPPTPMDLAEKGGKKQVVELLRRLEFPIMLDAAMRNTAQPVPAALLDMIRKNPSLADGSGNDGRTALHRAAAYGNAAFAAELVKIKPDLVRSFSASEETPLHVAAANKQTAVAKVLLASGASVRATNANGDTPLHLAARAGSGDMIKVLLDAGADPGTTNKDDKLAAEVASDVSTRAMLTAAAAEADQIRSAWSGIDLTGRGFDVTVPGSADPIRFRFKSDRSFSAEGNVKGAYKSTSGTYSKGPLTLTMEFPEDKMFADIAAATCSGKVKIGSEADQFSWKVGNTELKFKRR